MGSQSHNNLCHGTTCTLSSYQMLSGVPAEVATNGSFILAIRGSLSDILSMALNLISEVNVSKTLLDSFSLMYSINVQSCYSAGVVTASLQTAMDSGTFVKTLLQRTGVTAEVSGLKMSVGITTFSPSSTVVNDNVKSGTCHQSLFNCFPSRWVKKWPTNAVDNLSDSFLHNSPLAWKALQNLAMALSLAAL